MAIRSGTGRQTGQTHLPPKVTMPKTSLRTLSRLSVAFFLLAACTELYDTEELVDDEQGGEQGEGNADEGADAAAEDAPDPDASDEESPADAGESVPADAGEDEPDAAPCGVTGQSCCPTEPICTVGLCLDGTCVL
jgi:hypothetical protein